MCALIRYHPTSQPLKPDRILPPHLSLGISTVSEGTVSFKGIFLNEIFNFIIIIIYHSHYFICYFICIHCYNHFLIPTFVNLWVYISFVLFYLCLDFIFNPAFPLGPLSPSPRLLVEFSCKINLFSPPFPVVILAFLIGLQIKCDSCALWKGWFKELLLKNPWVKL